MVKDYPNERTALFIDGANLYSAARSLNFDIDYRKLLEYLCIENSEFAIIEQDSIRRPAFMSFLFIFEKLNVHPN